MMLRNNDIAFTVELKHNSATVRLKLCRRKIALIQKAMAVTQRDDGDDHHTPLPLIMLLPSCHCAVAILTLPEGHNAIASHMVMQDVTMTVTASTW